MNISEVFSLAVAAIGLAVTWGALTTRIKVLEAKVRELDKGLSESRKAQGRRIGRLERWQSFLKGAAGVGPPRRPSQAVPVVPDDEEPDSGPAADE